MTTLVKRTLKLNAEETSQVTRSMEALEEKLGRLKRYEEDMDNFQGDSIQRFTALSDTDLSREDWDRVDGILSDLRRLSMGTHARIEEQEAALKKELKGADDTLTKLYHERLALVAQEDTKGGQ